MCIESLESVTLTSFICYCHFLQILHISPKSSGFIHDVVIFVFCALLYKLVQEQLVPAFCDNKTKYLLGVYAVICGKSQADCMRGSVGSKIAVLDK